MSKSRLRRVEEDDFAFTKKRDEVKSVSRPESKSESRQVSRGDDFSFNFKGIFQNKKLFAIISIILLIAVAFGTSWYIRTRTLELPQTRNWAENNVFSFYKESIRQKVDQTYPNLPQASKDELVNKEFNTFYQANKANIDTNIDEVQRMIKQNFQDDSGMTYILNIDSFFFLRKARNMVEKGTYYDVLKEGVPFDDHMKAPNGLPAENDLHSASAAYLFFLVRIFNPDVSLPHVAFFIPVLLASLLVIPVFFIVRKKAGNFAGFFAALLFAIHPVFLGRTMGGDFDNDVQNVFFPLIITWLLLEMIETKSVRKKYILTTVMGVLTGVFSFAWKGGWWYMFDFVLGVFAVYIWYKLIKQIAAIAARKKIFGLSAGWARGLVFFGPLALGGIIFLLYSLAGIIFFGLYALCIFVYMLMTIIPDVLKKMQKKTLRHDQVFVALIVLIVYFIISGIFVSLFTNTAVFTTGILAPVRITALQQAANVDYWPNVYTTVAELNTTNFSGVISNIGIFGGLSSKVPFFFLIAIMGVILGLTREKMGWREYFLLSFSLIFYFIMTRQSVLSLPKFTYLLLFVIPIGIGLYFLLEDETVDVQFAIFLILWFVATIYAGTKGVRFIHLLVPAFAVAVGFTIGKVYNGLSNIITKELHINKLISKTCIAIFILLLLISPLKAADNIATNHVPIFDRAWYNAMDAVREDSKPDAIINSWWDFGHFFKYVADRGVTFDGAVQNSPPAHLIGKTLATDNQDVAVGLLRMLDCDQNQAFYTLSDAMGGTLPAISLMNQIIVVDKASAEKLLVDAKLSQDVVASVLEKTHCSPPEDYFVTSGDMIGKAGVWGHFGYWNFTRAYIYNNVRGKSRDKALSFLKTEFGMADDEAEQVYLDVIGLVSDQSVNSWISPWPGYVTQNALPCERKNTTVECRVNLGIGQSQQVTTVLELAIIDLENLENSSIQITAFDKTLTQRLATQIEKPKNFVITGKDGFITIPFDNGTFPYDIVVDTYNLRLVIADPLLSKSTFTKLFYLNGMYMDHFDKRFEERSQTQGNVIVWKVDWDGKSGAELEAMRKKWGIVEQEVVPVPDEEVVEDESVDNESVDNESVEDAPVEDAPFEELVVDETSVDEDVSLEEAAVENDSVV
ncbi:MAG: STT3 domain-containing protein [Nanoarchaeota archaeon]